MTAKFNERLVELLKENGYTQKALASKTGITEAAISHYVKGDRVPRASVLFRMAAALHTTPDDLLGVEKKDPQQEIQYARRLIARNVQQMTPEEKLEIIKTLTDGM